jgi:hypothetical protein
VARNPRIFISFAAEDARLRDLFVGQKNHSDTKFDFIDMSVKEPWDEKWKTNCRTKIKGCDGFIALLTTHTWRADGARWEMKCAKDEGIPMIGIHVYKDDKGAIPPELVGKKVIEWTWAGVSTFVKSVQPKDSWWS